MVLLHQQDVGCRSAFLCGVRDPAVAGVLTVAHPLCHQRHRHHRPYLPLYVAGWRKDGHLDRHAQELLPHPVGGAEHLLCCQGLGL